MSNPITSHVLNTASGRPGSNIRVSLEICTNEETRSSNEEYSFRVLKVSATNSDGRVPDLSTGMTLVPSIYRVVFFTQEYFDSAGQQSFYPKVEVLFRVVDPNEHYHIPLLISPFGYSTYRGS